MSNVLADSHSMPQACRQEHPGEGILAGVHWVMGAERNLEYTKRARSDGLAER
jgi:hypothetical protein